MCALSPALAPVFSVFSSRSEPEREGIFRRRKAPHRWELLGSRGKEEGTGGMEGGGHEMKSGGYQPDPQS